MSLTLSTDLYRLFDQRETELKLVIFVQYAALYGNDYYKERARDELKFLTFKLERTAPAAY
ncbi:MAG: hypothetical protein ACLU99_08635 [Alphaproteobacteria bacterium]